MALPLSYTRVAEMTNDEIRMTKMSNIWFVIWICVAC